MKKLFSYFSTAALSVVTTWIKPALIAASCALVIFANATPALAFGNSNSKPSDGVEQLDKIQQKSENAISSKTGEAKRVVKNSKEGLNGVQGKANESEMVAPDSANGTSLKETIKDAIEDIAS